jgi:hypothetical protein
VYLGKASSVKVDTQEMLGQFSSQLGAARWSYQSFMKDGMKRGHGKVLLQAGRQRQWVAPRAQLVYLAREWCGLTTKELGRRLHRDVSMISRLYGWYQGHRDKQMEEKLVVVLTK